MPRVVKDPEERKNELLETAEKMFVEKGYDNTLVSDIVKKAGVAQGTFYYYFKSKDEALAALLERKWEQFAGHILKMFEKANLNALEKLHLFFGLLFRNTERYIEGDVDFSIIKDPAIYNRFHRQFDEARVNKLKPIICGIVKDGINQKLFYEMNHPDEIVEIIFYGINTYMHIHSRFFRDADVYSQKMSALEELLERVLGLKQGSINYHS